MNSLLDHLVALYGATAGEQAFAHLQALIVREAPRTSPRRTADISERDAILITYGDQISAAGEAPLQTLGRFAAQHVEGVVSGIHILPFYPYSSDDGFSVIDYRAVNPALGTWQDIDAIGKNFRLMFDLVLNHVSASSEWFRRFLHDDPAYSDFFIVVPEVADVSRVVRPRALPIVTRFSTPGGPKDVWTTFSADQVDLNYHNPDVLLAMIKILLEYVAHGAEFIRLDAIAFLWKEYGTTCLHLPQTHSVVQLLRAVLDQVAPYVILITETNVPHADNVTYFGDGTNEAQMIYNFALPPLVLHTLLTGRAQELAHWASRLTRPSAQTAFFNFLASHDGIGLNPVRGILRDSEIDALVESTVARGGRVSYKNNPDGTVSPYELNINYYDALSGSDAGEPPRKHVERFIASQAIMLCLPGVPGIYFHSLFGSRGWPQGVEKTGTNRAINREKLRLDMLEHELQDPTSQRHAIFEAFSHLLRVRAAHSAFHPRGEMRLLDGGPHILALLRSSPDESERVLCLQNVTREPQPVSPALFGVLGKLATHRRDLVADTPLTPASLRLAPYQTVWAV